MKQQSLLLVAFIAAALSLGACNRQPAPAPATTPEQPAAAPATTASPADASGTVGAAPAAPGKVDVAGIEASGKTGLWAEPAGVCAKGDKDGILIAWNAKATGAAKVDVNIVDKSGKERNFAKGGPVGGKQTGRWVRPGQRFSLRNSATNEELGNLTVADAGC